MAFAHARLAVLALGLFLVASTAAARAASRDSAQVWVVVSDIHLNPFDRSTRPSDYGFDSNLALFRSALAQMKRAAPDPSLILLPGDFLAHRFPELVRQGDRTDDPDQAGIRTMQQIASDFGRTFRNGRFAVALGNNDAPCGDYWSAEGSPYLTRISRIWAPLVNRRNAAPRFADSFARDGYYTMASPIRGVRLVVLNTLIFSQQYRGNCGAADGDGSKELEWLRATLRRSPATIRNVVMMHIPPGFDPFTTQYALGVLAWPFLKESYNEPLTGALASSADRVMYEIAGHAHRFDFRLAGDVPVIVFGSLSPIFGNDPAFYVLHVAGDGSLRDIDIHAFDESSQRWLPQQSFDTTWGTSNVDGVSLASVHARLASDQAARQVWGAQANGSLPTDVTHTGAWGTHWWSLQWCAQTFLTASYAECADIRWRRGLTLLLAAATLTAVAIFAFLWMRRRRSAPAD